MEKYSKSTPAYFTNDEINLADFKQICSQITDLADYPHADSVAENILIYSGAQLRQFLQSESAKAALTSEIVAALKDGPGVIVIKAAYEDLSVIDRSTELFFEIIAKEKSGNGAKGDHFGKNERIWNSIQKACVKDPDLFIDYYSNPLIALICEAWLGPYYRITAQVNNVKPSNKAQSIHRDYHLGFQSTETVARFPAHVQVMSQYLTLQGAVAHVDMPLEMGPTMFIPYSQQYEPGYMAYSRPEFAEYCAGKRVQLPLNKGDVVFLSPALFHGAGENVSQTDRLANLLQISSAFGRTMETLNNHTMIEAVYPALLKRADGQAISNDEIENIIAAVADGYAFPTNLDLDPPIGGNAPPTQQDIMRLAVQERWSLDQLKAKLTEYAERREA